MKSKLSLIIILFLVGLLMFCSHSPDRHRSKTQKYVVRSESIYKMIYFTGTIQPLSESSLISPVEAIVDRMYYHYGQRVEKGETIFTLNSNDLQRQYNDVLTDYLKSKDNFTVVQARFSGTADLWKDGLISKNNYLNEKSSVDTARVALMQATHKLSEMLEKVDDERSKKELSSLSIAEFDKVKQVLATKHNFIHIKAPKTGILLYPPKSAEDKSSKLGVGSAVKSGQAIGLIGDLSGVSVEIEIPEVDIDKVHTGMKATITGVGLGKEVLNGEVIAVNAQASATTNNALPSFTAVVEVKQLTMKQQTTIKVGMSAAIALETNSGKQLLIPIAALEHKQGRNFVTIQDKKGTNIKRMVVTGEAQVDNVVIETGLREGDIIIYAQ